MKSVEFNNICIDSCKEKCKIKCQNKRTERIEIRCSLNEKNQLSLIMEQEDYHSIASLFREIVFNNCDRKPVKKITLQDPKLVANVAKIGNNINQITRRVNAISQAGRPFSAIELHAILNCIHSQLETLIKTNTDAK